MQNLYLSSLIFAFLTSLSVATTAAPSIKPEPPTPISTQMTKAEQSYPLHKPHIQSRHLMPEAMLPISLPVAHN